MPEANRFAALSSRGIVKASLDLGFRVFDTSPYYGPLEELLGDALSQPDIVNRHRRDDYLLMIKVGRIGTDEFNYSPSWIDHSVRRSLSRLQTSFIDVVFCHDNEFVQEEEALAAVGVLVKLRAQGLI
ncbi:D-arabinose 1-dehydrogenase [Aspergillus udagawae]|uniref:D-arabinose 1-dehydrogenase n=1 Tax=Aspergillus udagawae TaxID=91492 RepID=A0ABQ1BEX9_9EURO|nr:D-arabinose 1-dehydrogenase [Aspergillus udagawae]GFG00335.1 D-arabinose 1-dehydrogenase [Aspergillus udagawae]